MRDNFIKTIDELYNTIIQPNNSINKIEIINMSKCKLEMALDNYFGEYYYNLFKANKENGVVYTPKELAKYIVESTVSEEDIIDNPYLKIIDPACGTGNIIIECFYHLKAIYLKHLDQINKKNNLSLNYDNINFHIINYNIHGVDIDELALKILAIDLYYLSGSINCENLLKKDFLIDELLDIYDIYIGNPPYIGHKSIDKEYSALIRQTYKDVYRDKGDLSYCFFKKAYLNMSTHGKISFITSRYFMESLSGKVLRQYIIENFTILKIIDFYGVRPFKHVGIDPVIIFLGSKKSGKNYLEILKPINKEELEELPSNDYTEIMNIKFCKFYKLNDELDYDSWVLRDEKESRIIKKIEQKCFHNLQDLCYSYQGIITGCDKAFIVSKETIEEEKLEWQILKPWIKSSNINKTYVKEANNYIIYSNLIDDEKNFPNAIRHIENFKERLLNRRECIKGSRKWYELQWGRENKIFDSKKVIFPYKSSNSRFTLDIGNYFSADVYTLEIKEPDLISYEFLTFLLNSSLYEFYFKTFAKKLGGNLYEYYPNNLMKLKIPVNDLKNLSAEEDSYNEEELYNYFGITEEEKEIIFKKSRS